jgi:hypothetical protein
MSALNGWKNIERKPTRARRIELGTGRVRLQKCWTQLGLSKSKSHL